MSLLDVLVGLNSANGRDVDDIDEMMKRLREVKVAEMGEDRTPGFGLTVQPERSSFGANPHSDSPAPVSRRTGLSERLPEAQAPSTTPWRATLETPERLEKQAQPEQKNFTVPQTAPIVQTPRQAEASRPAGNAAPSPVAGGGRAVREPDFWDRLGAFSRGYNTGGLVGAVADGFGSGLDRQVETQNMTMQALIKQGLPEDMAAVAVRNPQILQTLLAQMVGKGAPDLKTIKVKDEYGRETEVPVVYNSQTRRFERVDIGGGASPAPGGSAAPGGNAAPVTAPGPIAPAAPMAAPRGELAAPRAPQAPGAAAPAVARPAPSPFQERPVNVNTLPAPAKGYTYDLGPGGFPQFDARNNPKMISDKDLEARSKKGEGSADDAFKLRETIAGIDKTFKLANDLSHDPGLPDAVARAFGGEMTIKGIGFELPDITPGTAQADAFNKHKTLLSDVALRTMDQLKAASAQGATGFGALSEKELGILQSSAGNLKLTSSYGELVDNYKKFQSHLMHARGRLLDKYQEKHGAAPEGIQSKQQLIDDATAASLNRVGQPIVRPRRIGPFDIPFTSTTDPMPDPNEPAWYDKPPFYYPQLDARNLAGGSSKPAPRGIPEKAPPNAQLLPPNSGYPPGTKASRNPNNPKQWIIWEPD